MTNTTSWQPSDIMNPDSGNDADSTESPKRPRGRIPQAAWPRILQRYRAGATLSAIAREFDCTPSAISYIVRKAEAEAETGAATTPPATEPMEAPPPAPPAAAATLAPSVPSPVPQRPSSVITTLSLPDRGSSQPRLATSMLSQPGATSISPPTSPQAGISSAPPPTAEAPRPVEIARPTEAVRPVDSVRPAEAVRPIEAARPPEAARPAEATRPPEARRPAAPETGTAKPAQPPPVDAVEARLRETARGCLVAYRGWRQAAGETSTQALNDAVHELRKVLARIEIDMSASRREEPGLRPIPVPAHRAARQQQQRG